MMKINFNRDIKAVNASMIYSQNSFVKNMIKVYKSL